MSERHPDGGISREKRGSIYLIGLDRPEKYNGLTPRMMTELIDAFGELENDPDLRVGVVFGHGKHFTAGLDLEYASRQFPPSDDPGRAAEARLRHIEWLQDSFNAVESLAKRAAMSARPPDTAGSRNSGCGRCARST